MNDRIQELARQSGGIDMTNHTAGGITTWVGTGTPEFLERFAELIIAECCVALHPMLRDMISRTQAVDMIVRHFRDEQDDPGP